VTRLSLAGLASMKNIMQEMPKEEWAALRKKAQERAMLEIPKEFLGKYRDAEAKKLVRYQVLQVIEAEMPGLEYAAKQAIAEKLTNEISGYGPLEKLLDDESITEILVERFDKVVVERDGILNEVDVVFDSEEHLRLVTERILSPLGRRLDYTTPFVDARLPDGSRVNAVSEPVAVHGTQLSIRKFKQNLSIDDLINFGAINKEIKEAIKACVEARLSVIISGGTGSGKSSFLNAISEFIHPHLSIITIENPIELKLKHPRVRSWEARPPNLEGKGEISQLMLVVNALRARPDIIIIGEVRGAEAFALLQALNTGHNGSMTSLHANSTKDAMKRLVSMVASAGQLSNDLVPDYVSAGIDIVIQLSRMEDGSRKLVEIAEVLGTENGEVKVNPLVKYVVDGYNERGKIVGHWEETGNKFTRLSMFNQTKTKFPGWLGGKKQ
jgi:pilus assembly protein CpaF